MCNLVVEESNVRSWHTHNSLCTAFSILYPNICCYKQYLIWLDVFCQRTFFILFSFSFYGFVWFICILMHLNWSLCVNIKMLYKQRNKFCLIENLSKSYGLYFIGRTVLFNHNYLVVLITWIDRPNEFVIFHFISVCVCQMLFDFWYIRIWKGTSECFVDETLCVAHISATWIESIKHT